MVDDQTGPRFAELLKDARAAVDHVEQAQKLYARGDTQAAANVIGLTPYKLNQALSDVDGLLKYWSTQGVEPGSTEA
jgi:hypothetical protein